MISAVLENKLAQSTFKKHPVFGMMMPVSCPGVPADILDPRNTWADTTAYDAMATKLAGQFISNFEKYAGGVSEEILAAAPLAGL